MKILITLIACLVIGCGKSGKTIELEAENKRFEAELEEALGKKGNLSQLMKVLEGSGQFDKKGIATIEEFLKSQYIKDGKTLFELKGGGREEALIEWLTSPAGIRAIRGTGLEADPKLAKNAPALLGKVFGRADGMNLNNQIEEAIKIAFERRPKGTSKADFEGALANTLANRGAGVSGLDIAPPGVRKTGDGVAPPPKAPGVKIEPAETMKPKKK